MLNAMRESFKNTPYLKWILGLVALGLVLYLGNYFIGNGGGATGDEAAWAARINGTAIPTRRFIDTARNLDQYYRRLFGDNYDQLKGQLQIGQQAIQQLIDEELILQDARRMGLRGSKQDLVEQIRSNPSFKDESGRFIGRERYRQLVERGFAGGVPAFERSLADDLLTEKWTNLVTQPVRVADDELERTFRQRTEKTAIDYVIVGAADQEVDRDVQEDELRRWYDEHADRYYREEGRKIRFAVIDREAQRAKVQVTDEEIRASYETNQASYSHPEQRRARHILFRLEPDASGADKQRLRDQAEKVLERVKGGEDFGAIARSTSQDATSAERDGDLGFFSRGAMVEPFEEAAFNTPVGQYAPVVESPFGFHVIQVTDSRAAGVTPLGQVEQEIRRSLELNAAQDRVLAEAERLAAEIATADRLQQVAEANGLTVEARTVTAGDRLRDLGAAPDFVPTVLSLEPGAISPPLRVASGMALVAVDEKLPPSVAPFEDVRDQVQTDLLDERARQAALAAGRRALERHSDLARAAAALKLEVQSSGDLAPGQVPSGTGGSSPDLERELFGDGPEVGKRGVVAVPVGALVYVVTGREPFDPERFESERASLMQEMLGQRRVQYRQAILGQLRASQEIEVNVPLLRRFSG